MRRPDVRRAWFTLLTVVLAARDSGPRCPPRGDQPAA